MSKKWIVRNPIRIALHGDENKAKSFISEGRRILLQLHNMMDIYKRDIGTLYRKFADGTLVRASSHLSCDTIFIESPSIPIPVGEVPVGVVKEAKKVEIVKEMALRESGIFFVGQNVVSPNGFGMAKKLKVSSGDEIWGVENLPAQYTYYYKVDYYKKSIYIASQAYPIHDWRIEKRSAKDGALEWVYGHNLGRSIDVVVDSTGVYVVGGTYAGSPVTELYTRIEKYDHNGNLMWVVSHQYPVGGTDYERAVDCALDANYLYVTSWLYNGPPIHYYGILRKIDKSDGSIVQEIELVSISTDPFAYNPYEIAVATASKTGNGNENVYLFSPLWVKPLDDRWIVNTNYGYNYIDYTTIDLGLAVLGNGIYIGGEVIYEGYFPGDGRWRIEKYDTDGVLKWSTVYDEYYGSRVGPGFNDLAINEDGVFVAGYVKTVHSPAKIVAVAQKLDLSTGEIKWTHFEENDTYSFFWGVCAYDKKIDIPEKEVL